MLTPDEVKIIEYGKNNGKSPEEGFKAIAKYRAEQKRGEARLATVQPEKKGFFGDLVDDVKGVFTGIGDSVKKRGGKLATILEADANKEQGKASTMLQTTTNFLGGVSDVAGEVIKGGAKAVLTQNAENKVKEALGSVGQKVMELPEVQQFISNYKEIEKSDPELARNIVALEEGGEFLLNFIGLKYAKDATKAGLEVGKEAIKAGAGAADDLARSGAQLAKTAVDKTKQVTAPFTKEAARIPSRISTNLAEKQAIEKSISQLPTKTAQLAARDGIDLSDIKTVVSVATKKANKPIIRELVKTVKGFSKGGGTNPIEIVGKPMVSALKKIESLRGSVGKKLGAVADDLGKVTEVELRPAVLAELKKVRGLEGLKTTMNGVLDFSDTVLATQLSKSDRMAIRKIFTEAVRSGTGKSKHLLRQELFEILGGAKRSTQALTATQERAFEATRKALSNILDSKNTTYKSLNLEYAKLMKPLSDMRRLMKAVGDNTDDDILNMSGGLIARRLTSHAPSNPQIRAILRSMDDVLKTSSKGTEAGVEALQDVYNVLNRYYDIAGKTSFQGQTRAGIESAKGFGEFAASTLRNVAGESDAVRQKALEKLLDELLR